MAQDEKLDELRGEAGRIRLGVIGCGRWGPNYVRNFSEMTDSQVIACADPSDSALTRMRERFPGVRGYADYREMIGSDECDAVVVVTPASTHREIAQACLQAGKHVLVEKPLASTAEDAVALMECERAPEQILMVGHIFRFNSAVNRARELVYDGTLGQVRYLHFIRTNLGPVRKDVSVLWDLAPHDVSMALYLLNATPRTVSATTQAYLKTKGDVGVISLTFGDGCLATIFVSWIDPRKQRRMDIVGSRATLQFDDMNLSEPLRICHAALHEEPSYDTFGEFQLIAHSSNVIIPTIESREPLKVQCEHFLQCIRSGKQPTADVEDGVRVCQILAAAEQSAANGGAPVEIQNEGSLSV